MSIIELKEEAIRQFALKVEAMKDETALKEVLDFLSGIKGGDAQNINLSRHYNDIKAKHGDVLKKLAE
jgi:hypothetical protein